MIKFYKDGKLFRTYEEYEMKDLQHIKLICCDLGIEKLLKKVEIPALCEEPFQYTMRQNGFILQSY